MVRPKPSIRGGARFQAVCALGRTSTVRSEAKRHRRPGGCEARSAWPAKVSPGFFKPRAGAVVRRDLNSRSDCAWLEYGRGRGVREAAA